MSCPLCGEASCPCVDGPVDLGHIYRVGELLVIAYAPPAPKGASPWRSYLRRERARLELGIGGTVVATVRAEDGANGPSDAGRARDEAGAMMPRGRYRFIGKFGERYAWKCAFEEYFTLTEHQAFAYAAGWRMWGETKRGGR